MHGHVLYLCRLPGQPKGTQKRRRQPAHLPSVRHRADCPSEYRGCRLLSGAGRGCPAGHVHRLHPHGGRARHCRRFRPHAGGPGPGGRQDTVHRSGNLRPDRRLPHGRAPGPPADYQAWPAENRRPRGRSPPHPHRGAGRLRRLQGLRLRSLPAGHRHGRGDHCVLAAV